jgi:hypothetical protein
MKIIIKDTHTACNSYKSTEKNSSNKSDIQKYSHYWTRFNTHRQSEKFEENIFKKANENAQNMEYDLFSVSGIFKNIETKSGIEADNSLEDKNSLEGNPLSTSLSSVSSPSPFLIYNQMGVS